MTTFARKKAWLRWKYLCIIILVFIIGTSIDIACKSMFRFAIGGLGGILGVLVSIVLMYRYKQEKFSWHSLLKLLKLRRPQLPTICDKVIIASIFVAIVVGIFVYNGVPSLSSLTGNILLFALSAAIIPAFTEELLDRGFILSSLVRMGNSNFVAVGVSSAFFSLSHIPNNLGSVPIALLLGIIFAIITIRTKSIILALFMHGLWNFLATITSR